MENDPVSLLGLIRRNDPGVTSVTFNLQHDYSRLDADITEALEQNLHIVAACITVHTFITATQNIPRLLHHLEARNNLHKVDLCMWFRAPQAKIASFLQAFQRNTNLREVRFYGFGFAPCIGTIVPFLTAAACHLTDLAFSCEFGNNNGDIDSPAVLAASLQRITNLQSLKLDAWSSYSEFATAIFVSLKRNPSLQTLAVDVGHFSDVSWASFKGLMRSSSTIRKLVLYSAEAHSKNILEIAKFNFSLRVVRTPDIIVDMHGKSNIFTEEEHRLLAFYADRNERMDQWIEDPDSRASVPKKLRSNVLYVAAQAGDPSVLFRSLLAIKGDLGRTKNTRKRKRPVLFKP